MTTTVIADAKQLYKGRALRAGEEFDVDDEEADDLEAIGFASRKKKPKEGDEPASADEPAPAPAEAIELETNSDNSDNSDNSEITSKYVTSKERYQRRDQRARK